MAKRNITNIFKANKSKTTFSEGRKSAGVRDNYPKRHIVYTQEIELQKINPSGDNINIEDSKMGHFTGGTVGYLYFNGANGNIELTNTNSVGGDIILTPKDSNNIVDITTHKITNVVDPTNAQDGATKNYIDTKDVESFSTSLTAGSVVFSDGSNLSEDNSNFFYDQANTRIGIRETSPDSTFEIVGSSDATEDVYKAKAGANTLHTFQTVFHITDKNDLTVVKAEVRGSDQAGTFYLPAIRTIPSRDAQGLGITTSTGTAQHVIAKGFMCETGYAASYSPALLTGYVYGGKDSGDDLFLMSTNHATKGFVNIAPTGGNVAVNNVNPTTALDVTGTITGTGLDINGASNFGTSGNEIEIEADGDMIFKGTAGLVFGSFYGNDIGWTQVFPTQNEWYNIVDASINTGQLNNITHDGNGKLTVTEAGMYLVNYSIDIQGGTGRKHLEAGIELNGSGSGEVAGRSHFEIQTANTEINLSSTCICDLADNDTFELAVRTTDTSVASLSVHHINISVVQIGGT